MRRKRRRRRRRLQAELVSRKWEGAAKEPGVQNKG
jgi:hypothetical protein